MMWMKQVFIVTVFLVWVQLLVGQNPDEICTTSSISNKWTSLGPYETPIPYPEKGSWINTGIGMVWCVAVDSISDPTFNTIYIGTNGSGLWKTINGGKNWTCLTDTIRWPATGVQDIAINPQNPNEIYIALGLHNFQQYGIGVAKTEDGGVTWNMTGLNWSHKHGSVARQIYLNPQNPTELVATSQHEVFYSKDAGNHWDKVYSGKQDRGYLWWLEAHPTNEKVLYIVGQVLLRSEDGGKSWVDITDNIPNAENIVYADIAVTRQHPDKIHLVYKTQRMHYIYQSTDRGATWEKITKVGLGSSHFHKLQIEVNQLNDSIVYLAGVSNMKTTNGGESWSRMKYPSYAFDDYWWHMDIRELRLMHSSPNGLRDQLISANDGGISVSDDGLKSTRYINGNNLVIGQILGMDICETCPGVGPIITGWQDMGTMFGPIPNIHFSNIGGDGGSSLMSNYSSKKLLAMQNWKLHRSLDGGVEWKKIHPRTKEKPINHHMPLAFAAGSDEQIWLGLENLWYSPNLGDSWKRMTNFPKVESNGLPGQIDSSFVKLADFDFCDSKPSVGYAVKRQITFGKARPNGQIYRLECTLDTCIAEDISKGDANLGILEWNTIWGVAVDPIDEDLVYLAVNSKQHGKLIFRSRTGGRKYGEPSAWEDISEGLPFALGLKKVVALAGKYHPLYVSSDVGVWYRDDRFDEWQCFNEGLPAVVVRQLAMNTCENTLYAGTFGRGLFVADAVEQHEPIVVKGKQVWEGEVSIPAGIILGKRAELTIKGNLLIGEKSVIALNKKSELIIDGGTVTSACRDGNWKGLMSIHQNEVSYLINQRWRQTGQVKLKNGGQLNWNEP